MVTMQTPAPQVLVRDKWLPEELEHLVRHYDPKSDLGRLIKDAARYLPPEMALELVDRVQSTFVVESQLAITVIRNPESRFLASPKELFEEYGVVCRKVITTAGVNFLVDAFQNSTELENLKYHGIGTGNTAEAAGDTALVTELTTEYNPNSTRATGTTTEGASANIYRTVGTNTLDSGTPAITEHGVFSQAATGGGTLWDRSVFSAINLDGTAGDGLQSTYEATFSSGG